MSGNSQLDPTIDAPNSSSVAGMNANNATQVTSPAGASAAAAADGSPMFGPPVAEGEVGRMGRYRVLKKLGQGGMGAVYVAVDETLQRKIALKVMLPKFAADRDARERFLREARATAQLTHDNVVTIFEAAELDGLPFLAMQYLQGYPLDEFLKKKGTPPLPHVLRIGREVAAGLAAAHAVGLIHRDIKPGNLWLEAPNARVKILDFGLAKSLGGAADVELTQSGAIVGTPAYMSPEQARGEKLDGRSDLFSLGGVLYFLCGGRLPFTGPNMMAVLTALATTEPTPIRELNPNVSAELAALIHKLLAKNPADRPQSAAEVVKLLDAARAARPQPTAPTAAPAAPSESPLVITAQPIDFFANLGIDPTSQIPSRSAKAKPKSKSAAKPIPKSVWLTGGAIAVVLLGVLLAKVFNKDESSTASNNTNGGKSIAKSEGSATKKKGKPSSGSPAARSNKNPVATDPDRRAAEYVVSIGGVVRINDEPRDITTDIELPNAPFQLTQASLDTNPQVTDAGLANFKDCTHLTSLNLYYTKVTDAGLVNFKDCQKLLNLNLKNANVTDAGLAHFKDCKVLDTVVLALTRVTDDGLAQFKDCPNLKSLILEGTQVTDAGMVHLTDLKMLGNLNLRATDVTAAGFAALQKALPECKIEWIDPGNKDADRKFAERVVKFDRNHVDVLVPGVPNLVRAGRLADLPSGSFHVILAQILSPFTEREIELLLPLEHLTTLFFNFSTLNDDDIKRLLTAPSATNWTRLLVTSDMMTDDSVLAISQTCTSLESLSLKMCPLVTDAGLEHLSELPQLRILELVAVPITGQCFDRLRKNQFVELYIHAGVRLTDEGLQHIGAFTELERLLIIAPNVTDRGLEHLRPLAKLDGLQLTTPAATDRCLTTIGSLKSLTRLNLHNIPITDNGLTKLHALSELTILELNQSQVTAAGLAKLKTALPKCNVQAGATK